MSNWGFRKGEFSFFFCLISSSKSSRNQWKYSQTRKNLSSCPKIGEIHSEVYLILLFLLCKMLLWMLVDEAVMWLWSCRLLTKIAKLDIIWRIWQFVCVLFDSLFNIWLLQVLFYVSSENFQEHGVVCCLVIIWNVTQIFWSCDWWVFRGILDRSLLVVRMCSKILMEL